MRKAQWAIAAALALAALAIAANLGVKGLGAVPDVLRAAAALLVLLFATGYAPARLLAPPSAGPLIWLLVPVTGAATGALSLTVLGFARVPLNLSLALVLAGGAAAGVAVRRKLGPAPFDTGALAWPVYLAALAAAILLLPMFQAGYTSVPGTNPDGLLSAGSAELLQHNPPATVDVALPVDEMPPVWRSKYPIYYVLAGASTLSGLDPVRSIATVGAVLAVLAAAGFMLLARLGLGAGPLAATGVMGVVALDRAVGYLAIHPYFNQLWGLLALGPLLLFGLRWIDSPGRRDGIAAALFGVLGLAAYPLMVIFPALALGGAAVAARRCGGLAFGRPQVPRSRRARIALAAAAVVALPAALVLLAGVLEKSLSAANLLLGGESLAQWRGDLTSYLEPSFFVGTAGPLDFLAPAAAIAAAVAGLRLLPRPAAAGIGTTIVIALALAAMFRLREFGEYFHFKLLAFLAPLVLTVAAIWVASVARRGPTAGRMAAVVAAAFVALQLNGLREQTAVTGRQLDRDTLALRDAARKLPAGASIRLDIPPDGEQLAAAYVLSERPLTTLAPLLNTTYPSVPYGRKADFVLVSRRVPASPDVVRPPVFRNGRFRIYRMRPGVPGPDRSSRDMVPARIGG